LAELATIYMGAHRPSELLRADRITELRQGALCDLDAAFSAERAPYAVRFSDICSGKYVAAHYFSTHR
jgi:hypothetical protein